MWPKKLKKVELNCPKVLCPLWIAPSCPELFKYSLNPSCPELFNYGLNSTRVDPELLIYSLNPSWSELFNYSLNSSWLEITRGSLQQLKSMGPFWEQFVVLQFQGCRRVQIIGGPSTINLMKYLKIREIIGGLKRYDWPIILDYCGGRSPPCFPAPICLKSSQSPKARLSELF